MPEAAALSSRMMRPSGRSFGFPKRLIFWKHGQKMPELAQMGRAERRARDRSSWRRGKSSEKRKRPRSKWPLVLGLGLALGLLTYQSVGNQPAQKQAGQEQTAVFDERGEDRKVNEALVRLANEGLRVDGTALEKVERSVGRVRSGMEDLLEKLFSGRKSLYLPVDDRHVVFRVDENGVLRYEDYLVVKTRSYGGKGVIHLFDGYATNETGVHYARTLCGERGRFVMFLPSPEFTKNGLRQQIDEMFEGGPYEKIDAWAVRKNGSREGIARALNELAAVHEFGHVGVCSLKDQGVAVGLKDEEVMAYLFGIAYGDAYIAVKAPLQAYMENRKMRGMTIAQEVVDLLAEELGGVDRIAGAGYEKLARAARSALDRKFRKTMEAGFADVGVDWREMADGARAAYRDFGN